MVRKPKKQTADIVFDKDGKMLSTQPNQITDLHMAPTLYSERAMDELVWALQPFYAAAKRRENRHENGKQLMLPFNNKDAYLVTPDRTNKFQHEGDFIATIRFRDLPGITPKHYGEIRDVLKGLGNIKAEVHSDDGILTTNLIDIIEEYETREITDPLTGEHRTVRENNLKRNEVKIRIRSEILQNTFFLTNAGYTQFYFPTTRHTKTATANRLYKWLSKWRGIKKDEMLTIDETLLDGTTRSVGTITFRADYVEVRAVCGLFNSQDGKVVNGEDVEALAVKLAKADAQAWEKLKKTDRDNYLERARQRAAGKYAYYSEFAKRYLAQAKKELDDLAARQIADFTFSYRAIFADGRAKGKVPLQVEFTLTIFDLGRELYEDKQIAAKEVQLRQLMQDSLALTARQSGDFIRRLQPGDHDHLLLKLQQLIDINISAPRNDLQHWAYSCINKFFDQELPKLRGFTSAEEVPSTPSPAPDGSPVGEDTPTPPDPRWQQFIDRVIADCPTANDRNMLGSFLRDGIRQVVFADDVLTLTVATRASYDWFRGSYGSFFTQERNKHLPNIEVKYTLA